MASGRAVRLESLVIFLIPIIDASHTCPILIYIHFIYIYSGLAVQPNPDMEGGAAPPAGGLFGAIRSRAVDGGAAGSGGATDQVRRRITMYRDGFTVDDGPFRRLDDPQNGEFLRSLAAGRTPKEMGLDDDGNPLQGDVVVGLVDKRSEDYVEPERVFAAFDGEGTSLGSAATPATAGGVIAPDAGATAPAVDDGRPTTSIQVRLTSGKRLIVRVNKTATVNDVAAAINASGDAGEDMYVLSAGFPPRPIEDLTKTVEEAGLAGSVVNQKKA